MELARYDLNWPKEYSQEQGRLVELLGDLAPRIEHVGSTSVPGLQAKAVIDIQISVASIDVPLYTSKLKQLGYRFLATDPPLGDTYPFFHKPSRWPTTHHVHLCLVGSEEERAHIGFRNWLRTHPEDRDYYGAMKDRLALDVDDADLNTMFAYTERKGDWIREIIAKALAAGLADV